MHGSAMPGWRRAGMLLASLGSCTRCHDWHPEKCCCCEPPHCLFMKRPYRSMSFFTKDLGSQTKLLWTPGLAAQVL